MRGAATAESGGAKVEDHVPTLKELEREVLAEKRAREQREVQEEVARRQQELERARFLKERDAERKRAQVLWPMREQVISGVTIMRVLSLVPAPFPIQCISLPQDIVRILQQAFDLEDNLTALSTVVSPFLKCLDETEPQEQKEARQKGQQYLAESSVGPTVEVPILTMDSSKRATLRDTDYIARVEALVPLICGWAIGYVERKEAQEALLQGA